MASASLTSAYGPTCTWYNLSPGWAMMTGYRAFCGWDYGISSHATTAQTTATMEFLNIAQDSTNLIDAANWAGWVPPVQSDWTVPLYTNFAAPFNEEFGKLLPYSSELPSSPNYSVWVQGIEQASGAIAQKPSTTGAQAMAQMKSFVTNQLGPSGVTTLP